MSKAFALAITITGAFFAQSGVAQDSRYVTAAQYRAGAFGVPTAQELVFSEQASKELVRLGEEIIAQRLSVDPDSTTEDGRVRTNAQELDQLIAFAVDYRGTVSSLTAKLLAVLLSHSGDVKSPHEAAVKMAEEILRDHPEAWQSKVVPFVKMRLVFDGDRALSKEKRLLAAREAIAPAANDYEATIVMDDPEVGLFLSFYGVGKLENPLRSSAMMRLASTYYVQAQDHASESDVVEVAWRESQVIYRSVISEYPATRAAERAEKMLKSISAQEDILRTGEASGEPSGGN